jgi:acetyltransferase-like isoleucine patch superfamily enzyme
MYRILINYAILISKIFEKIANYWNSIFCRGASEADSSVRFLSGAKIINARKSPNCILIGFDTIVRGELLTFAHDGSIEIGASCYIGENSRIWSAKKIEIGDRVLISHNVNIHDTDGHPINAGARHKHFQEILTVGHPCENIDIPTAPVTIEDDVWIGFNSTILKGVTIGRGAIIGASSVVTKDVPAYTIVAGNPAKFIRNIDKDEHFKNNRKTEENPSSVSYSIGTY